MKKETLEEVAIRLVKETTLYGNQEASIGSSDRSYFETELRCVLIGMKWQQERSYSEEDMRTSFGVGMKFMIDNKLSFEEWFEQFKNK